MTAVLVIRKIDDYWLTAWQRKVENWSARLFRRAGPWKQELASSTEIPLLGSHNLKQAPALSHVSVKPDVAMHFSSVPMS